MRKLIVENDSAELWLFLALKTCNLRMANLLPEVCCQQKKSAHLRDQFQFPNFSEWPNPSIKARRSWLHVCRSCIQPIGSSRSVWLAEPPRTVPPSAIIAPCQVVMDFSHHTKDVLRNLSSARHFCRRKWQFVKSPFRDGSLRFQWRCRTLPPKRYLGLE